MAFDIVGARKAGYSDDEIAQYLSEQKKFDYFGAVGAGYTSSEILNFLTKPERTVLGQVGETFKGAGRGFAGAFLSAGEGLAELADAATNVVGLKDAIDSGKENELVKASRAGRDWISNSALGVDPNYADAWWTKFGEGVGSMASFLTPTVGLRALGAAGKATRLGMGTRELGAAATLATGAGAGEQAQRVDAARAQGIDVSEGQEDAAVALGSLIGASEIAPIAQILKRVPSNITPADKSRILDLLQKSIRGGAEEAVQESGAGLLQDLTERGIYNENLPIGQSFWDDLTVGGAVGAFTDFVVNAAAGRRSFLTTEAQREYEAKAREREQSNIEKIRAALTTEAERRANRQADPAAFGKAAEAAQAGAVNIPAPTVDGAPVTAGQAYARLISRELGEFFPTNTKFEVKETEPTVTETGERIPNYVVVDSTGKQYGQPVQDYEQAVGLSYGLNNEVIDGQIRGQILNTLENAGQPYDQVTTDTLTRYGYQILNPEANMITSAALNEAAGTTADKGYVENYSFQTILDGEEVKEDGKTVGYKIQGPNQKETAVPGLTLAQKINQQRKAKGLPETQTFTVEEARDALGDKFERLTDINVQAIPDGMTYTATLIDGKPSVVSDVQEVFTSRFANQEDSDAAGKNEDGTPKVKVGQKIELQSLEDAQAFADRKNREAAKGQGLSIQEINALMKGEKTLTNEVTRLLKAKNVGSEIDTPEVKALFKSIVGKESLADMNFGEQRLLYARLRNLPMFEATTKLPLFEAKPYTRENFLRASKFVQDANALDQSVTDEQIAEAAGFLPGDERLQIKVNAIKQDLQKQGVPTVRAAKPVLALPAPTDTTDTYNFLREEIRKKMKGFGLDDIATRIDQTLLNYGDPVRYMQEVGAETEGYYNPFLREITLAVDRVDPNKTLTPEQRVNALVDVLNHEIVHPARELDLWTGQEWDTLSNAAAKLKRRDDQGNPINETYLQWARRTYADQSPLVQEEEAVADLSRQAKKFGAKAVAGKPKVLVDKLFKFFDRLDNSFRGAGFQNYSDILDRLQSGEIGARTRGEIRTLRATEAELAQQGILPERFADYQPIIATPVARNQEREKKKVQVQQQVQEKAPAGTDFNPALLENAAIRESRRSIESVPSNIEVAGRLKPTLDSENRVIYSGYEGPEVFGIQTKPTQEGLQNFWNWFGDSKTTDKQGRPLVFYHGTAADITAFRPKQAGSVFVTRSPEFAEEFGFLSDNYMVSNFPDFMSDQQVLEVLDETLANPASFSPKYYEQVSAAREQVAADVQAGKAIRPAALKPIKEIAAAGRSSRYLNAIQKRLPSSANMIPVYVKAENPFDYDNKEHINRVLKKVREISPIDLDSGQIEQFKKGDWKTIEGEDGNSPILDAIRELGFDSMYVEEQGEKNLAVFDPGQVKSAIGNNGDFSPLTPSIRESRRAAPAGESPNVVSIMSNEELPPRKMAGKTQVAQFLQDRALERLGRVRDLNSEADRDAIADDLVEEALYEMDVQKNALEWYDTTIERTIEMLALKHPEIKTDPNARTAFLTGLAITSQNLAVPDNLKYAEEVYSYFKRTGRFPEKGYGSKAGSIKKNFQKANELINQLGSMEAFTDFLQTKFRAGDLNGILKGHLGKGAKVGGELVDAPVYGSAVFGPKIGNGFYTNLRGDFSPVTIDMWFMRTIGRLRGKLMDFDEKKFAKQLNRLAKAEGMEGASTDDLVARARQLAKQHESDFKKFRSEYDAGIRKKSEATNAAITIVKSLKATRDAPSTGTERAQLRDVVNRAVSKLKDRTGQDIPPAAFQALIWYPEQDLYKKLGVKLRHVRQDYANSTKQFLRQSGVDERELKRAEDRVRSRRQRRAERVRPGTTGPVEGAVETPSSEVSGTLPQAETAQIIRESRARPKEQLDRAVKKAEENIAKAPTGAIPLYNLNATPESLYVAQNPDAGDKLDANDFIRYSRQNQPQYSPGVDQILDKLAVDPPNQTPGQTVIQSMQMPKYRDLIDKLRQQFIFNYSRLEYYNQNHPSLLQNSADVNSLVGAEMADRHRAISAAAVTDGVPVYRNGVTKVEKFIHNGREYKGLIDVMAPLYSNQYGNLERLAQSYAIALRGRRLTAEGKLAPGDPTDLPRLEAEVARFVNPSTGEPIIKEWYDAWQAYNGYVVQFLRDTGMIDDAGAQLWLQQSDYIPFYRETKAGTVAHPKIFGGLTSTTHMKSVGKSSEAINLPLLDSILTNLDAAIGMGMRNVAQQRIVRDMVTIGMGRMARPGEALEGLMTATFKVQGKKYTAILEDPLIFESMQALPDMGAAGILESVFRVPATVLRELITREPGYMVANMLRDTASAALTTGANIIPVYDTVKNFASGLDNLRRLGVVGGYDFARDPEDMTAFLADEAKKRGHKIPAEFGKLDQITRSKYMRPFKWAWDALGQVTDKAEASTRQAVYEDTLKRTGNEAEAIYQALSVINYGRRGRNPSLRALTAAVPFLNARIQGLDKLYQAGTGQVGAFRDRRKNFARFVMRAGFMVGLTGLYYALVSDDDEYKNANPETIDNYYILPTPMDFAVKIPIPFEVGLLFKTLPERALRRYHDVDVERDTEQSLLRAVTSTLAFNPVPQAVLPIAEVIANYDTFTGRALIPPYMDERMAAEYQARFGTNELARILGEATGMSPIKIDHLLNGYFGTLGTYTLDAVDHVMRDADRMYPSRDPYEYPFVRRFFADANQPGLQSQYYDLYKEVGKVTNTIRQLREDGRVDELNAYIMENQNILGVKTSVDYLNKVMKRYRDQKEAILKSPLEPDVKKELIDQMDADINRALQIIPVLKQAAFSEERQTLQ
jgi:hypothetical protein